MKTSLCLLLIVILTACFEEDKRVSPYPGEVFTIADSVQTHRSYFDFESGSITGQHSLDIWQLGFECNANGWHVLTNSGSDWFIYNTGNTNFDETTLIPAGLTGKYDQLKSWPDSTAVGNWMETTLEGKKTKHEIYLLAKYRNGTFKDIRQVCFTYVNDTIYRFVWKSSNYQFDTVTIRKNNTKNFVYYAFDNNKTLDAEPPKNAYDITFESYYDMATLFGQTMPYKVGGVLINPANTWIAADSVTPYETIDAGIIGRLRFSATRDIPGYDWKTVTVDITGGGAATYEVKSYFTYIIKTGQGNYYKLRFLSYTLDGKSGFPRFEFSKLE